MKVEIDREKCISCGSCATLAGEVFEIDEEGKAKVKEGVDFSDPEIKEKAKQAANSCPAEAIKVE